MDVRMPALEFKILFESSPPKSRILVRRLAEVVGCVYTHSIYMYIYIYIYYTHIYTGFQTRAAVLRGRGAAHPPPASARPSSLPRSSLRSRFIKGGCSGNRVPWFMWCYILACYIVPPPSTAPPSHCTPLWWIAKIFSPISHWLLERGRDKWGFHRLKVTG